MINAIILKITTKPSKKPVYTNYINDESVNIFRSIQTLYSKKSKPIKNKKPLSESLNGFFNTCIINI